MTASHRILTIFVLGALAAPVLFAEESAGTDPVSANQSLDSLFDDLEAGLPAGPSPTVVTPDSGKRPMFLYFGSLDTQALLISGFTDEVRKNFVASPYYYLHLQGGIDVMPIPEARLIGSFSSYLPQDIDTSLISTLNTGNTQTTMTTTTATASNNGSTLNLDELYLDYAVMKAALFRVGKYSVTWGQGKLFNPGNLVADSAGSVNLRGYLPLGPVNLTGMIIASKSFFAVAAKPQGAELGYAANFEFNLGAVSGGLSAYHQLAEGTSGDLTLRTGFWDFDFYTEVLAHHYYDDHWAPEFMVGTDKEFNLGVRVQTVAEYWLSASRNGVATRHVGFGLTTGTLVSGLGLKLSAKWLHSLTDGSGQTIVGLTAEPLPKMKLTLGLPWTYGAETSSYVTGNSDPEKRRLALMFAVTIGLDFEKDR